MKRFDLTNVPDDFLSFCWQNLSPRDRVKVMARAPATLWIFGAGASHHYDLNSHGVPMPLANGFFEAYHRLPTSQGFHAHVGPLISFLVHYRGADARQLYRWQENIEDFMTSIEAKIEEFRVSAAKKRTCKSDLMDAWSYAMAFNNMGFIFANVINEAQNGPSDTLYRYLLDFCSPRDTFVTFNWDTLLDRALVASGGWSPNSGYGLKFSSALDGSWKPRVNGQRHFKTNWRLLKLHGSTNWLIPLTHVNFQTFEYVSTVPGSNAIFLYWQSELPYKTHKSRWRGGYAPTCYCYYPPNIPGALFPQKKLAAPHGKFFLQVAPKGILGPFDEPNADGVPASALLITPVRQKKYDMYKSTINLLWRQCAKALEVVERVVIIGYSFPPTDTRSLKLLENALKARAKSISMLGAPELMRRAADEFPEVNNWIARIYAMNKAGL